MNISGVNTLIGKMSLTACSVRLTTTWQLTLQGAGRHVLRRSIRRLRRTLTLREHVA